MDETQETRKFNIAAEYTIKVQSGGIQLCKVRFPNDKEWAERTRSTKSITRFLGRDKTESVTNWTPANVALFDKIHISGGEAFDEAEKSWVIGRLLQHEVISCEPSGDGFRIELAVPGGIVTVHNLRVPKMKDTLEYTRSAVHSVDGRRMTEFHMSLEPSAILYDSAIISAEGYEGPVPIVHKDAVAFELSRAVTGDSPEV